MDIKNLNKNYSKINTSRSNLRKLYNNDGNYIKMINKYIYKKILEKMNLSKGELLKLKKELREDNICYGPFVKGNKMCPTTTALSIKLKVDKFRNNHIVSKKLKEMGIKKTTLMLYYLTFDFPAMVSHKFFKRKLIDFREVVDCLVEGR